MADLESQTIHIRCIRIECIIHQSLNRITQKAICHALQRRPALDLDHAIRRRRAGDLGAAEGGVIA